MTDGESVMTTVLFVVSLAIFAVLGVLSYHYGYYEGRACVMDHSCMPKADK